MKEELRKWAEDFPAYLSSRTDYAKGYKDGIVRAKQAVLEMLNEVELEEVEDRDIYSIFYEAEVKWIKIEAYFYRNDDGWKKVEFCGLQMPLYKFLDGVDIDVIESEAKQYITDFESVNDAYEALKEYKIKPLSLNQVNDNTLEGVYY